MGGTPLPPINGKFCQDYLKNDYGLENEDDLKTKDDLKNEDDHKKLRQPQKGRPPQKLQWLKWPKNKNKIKFL